MIRNYTIPKKNLVFMAPILLLLLASCGSAQYSGYEDGIYGDSNQRTTQETAPVETEQSQYATQDNSAGSYYKNLFAEKSAMYGELAENMIFTDVDDYSSSDGYEEETYQDDGIGYVGGNAPWGEDPDEYTVNIYNNGFGGFYNPWRWGNPYFHGGFWASNFHYGGWNNPFFWDTWGWGNPYWGSAWGYGPYWGSRFGFGFGFGGMYGGMYGPGRWGWANNYWGVGRNYYHRDVAYNAGRRNSYGDYTNTRRDANVSTRNSSYSRSIRNIRSRSNEDGTIRRAAVNRNDNSRIYSRSTRTSQPARVNSQTNRRSNSIYNNSRSNRSNNTYNRSSSPTRSSGTMRSSSPARSSGTVRSSGGGATRSSGTRGGGRG